MINKQSSAHYLWGENCDSWVLTDTEGLSIKQESMPGGTKEKLHFHSKAQQFFFVLHGIATMYVDAKREILREHQGLLVMPGVKHFIANETMKPLGFLVISQPNNNNDRTNIE
ncbi:MAG TPA: cupin domain-containing protein [Hanamia sp.]|nr:cupin domain-containing protein [Hanamia sp.]